MSTWITAVLCLQAADRPPVIVTGWDSPTPRQFREGLEAFERWKVFDGTTIRPTRTAAGIDARNAFLRDRWTWEEFAPALAELKAARPTTCRETYLMIYTNPGDVDWFDDAGWAEIVSHWSLLSRLAAMGGLRGLLFDAEPYTKGASQFLYRLQPERDRHSFTDYLAQARRRGREVMEAVKREFPSATIFSYRLFSDLLPVLDSGNPIRALEADTYGLLPAFVDGWLDVMPPGMRVIEGTEDIGYRANSQAEYDSAFTRLRLRMRDFVDPVHRTRVDAQFKVGQSLYLDAHVNPPGNPWHIDRKGGTPASRLAANLRSALSATDGLVWLYGEQARWWAAGNPESPMWPDALPGAIEAIRRAKDPDAPARDFFARRPLPANLLPNGDFAKAGASGAPEGWWSWQDEKSKGRVSSTDGRVALSGMLNGVLGTEVEVRAGHRYAVRLRVRGEGRGTVGLAVGWKSASGQWVAHGERRTFLPGAPAEDGWSELQGMVEVPASASRLVFMPMANAQVGPADRGEFDDAFLAELSE